MLSSLSPPPTCGVLGLFSLSFSCMLHLHFLNLTIVGKKFNFTIVGSFACLFTHIICLSPITLAPVTRPQPREQTLEESTANRVNKMCLEILLEGLVMYALAPFLTCSRHPTRSALQLCSLA